MSHDRSSEGEIAAIILRSVAKHRIDLIETSLADVDALLVAHDLKESQNEKPKSEQDNRHADQGPANA